MDADLRNADLASVSLLGARMKNAQLQGADLRDAQMQGAHLTQARMQGAGLSYARMQGADLSHARMQGANLSQVELQGAHLTQAQMQGAHLSQAHMQGAYLDGAQMQCAERSEALLQGADPRGAHLWRARAPRDAAADLALADLRAAEANQAVTKDDLSKLTQSLGEIPEGQARQAAEQRLQAVLAPTGDPPELAYSASRGEPVLAPDSLVPPLFGDKDALITTSGPAYVAALAGYLGGTLAESDPAVASGIFRRVLDGLNATLHDNKPDVEETRVAAATACRLLDGHALQPTDIDRLQSAVKASGQACPNAPADSKPAP